MTFKVLWHSNSPAVPSGYGNQTKLFTPRIRDAGYDTVISAYYGRQGASAINQDGILELPNGIDPWGNDVIGAHMNRVKRDMVFSLCDPWVLDPQIWSQHPWAAWVPIDCTPVLPANVAVLQAASWVISMSQFGDKELRKVGFDPIYIPHGIDPKRYHPIDRQEARAEFEKYTKVSLLDKYLVVTVAANKGAPSRKNFIGMIEAFSIFAKDHPDALYYIHTEPDGLWSGENLRVVAQAYGVGDKVIFPDQYDIVCSMVGGELMNAIYNAADIFMLLSRGEGFGIPIMEAQSAGCPVIVTKGSACDELCLTGFAVEAELEMLVPPTRQWRVHPHDGAVAMETMWQLRESELIRQIANARAQDYAIDHVMEKYMLPALEMIGRDIEEMRAAKNITPIPKVIYEKRRAVAI